MSYQKVLWQDILGGQVKSIIFVSVNRYTVLIHPKGAVVMTHMWHNCDKYIFECFKNVLMYFCI